ncbi:MAG: carbohydrate kinase family protein [Pyrinomonadaceae bacterium]
MEFHFDLKKDRKFDVVGFGTNAVDYLISVPEYPQFDSKIELTDYNWFAGGEIATTMTGLQRLGLKTAYAGRFGDDNAGDFGIQTLKDEGIDCRYAEQIKGAKTQIAFIIIDERNGERTVIWKRDEALSFAPDETVETIATDGAVLHFTPHDLEACIKLAEIGRAAGTIISIDVDRVTNGIEALLRNVDLLVCSKEFASEITSRDEPRDALVEIQKTFGSPFVGITLGEKGSLSLYRERIIETKGYQVPGGCKDTTGAGDSFRSGLLFGLLSGWSVEDSCRAANAVAALKCRSIGARTALPSRFELDAMLLEG